MLIHNQNFNIKQIAASGQCFRMNRMEDENGREYYELIAFGRYLKLYQIDEDTVDLSCSQDEFHQIWEDYFDLNFDYGVITNELARGEDTFLKKAVSYGKGIRILKQEPFEAAISFIISQNKNIPAIKNCIEGICRRYGERKANSMDGSIYYTFPSAEALAKADKAELRSLKTGYRDEYILQAAKAVSEGKIDFSYLMQCSYYEAVSALKNIKGIGEKVANCISLYGLHHIDGFPVDVWIKRVLEEVYDNRFDKNRYKGYAGIIQQYMFYYIRYLKGIVISS